MRQLVLANWFLFVVVSVAAAAPPDVCTFKIATMPDFCQTDKEGKFYDNGKNFCGPTAVCNSFVWLADHGFPNLLDKTGGLKNGQIALIQLLANEEQMDTVSKDGTGSRNLMIGIKRYVESKGYEPSRLECQGWRPVAKPFSSEQSTVSLDWLREGIADPCGSAWINIGWYQRGDEKDTWTRKGGHWMTIAGYGVKENGDNDPAAFVAYDPAPRSGKGNVAHYFHLEEIQSGKLTGEEKGLPRDAAGNYKIIDGIVPKKGMDAVIIDSAVVLILKKPAEK